MDARTPAPDQPGTRLHPGAGPSRPRMLRRLVLGVVVAAGAVLAVRQVTNASTFQVFGDYVARVDIDEPVVALTFDDGPHPIHTVGVLDVLDRHGIKATFFLMGRNIERFPAVARQVLARGHEIGNHSYSHPRLVLMSARRVREEIERTDHLLRDLGVSGEIHVRPPHLAKLLVLPYVLREMGRLSVLADVDAEEWRGRPATVMTAEVLRLTRPGSIILMHDPAGAETLRMLEDVLPALIARGYRFETVSELTRRRSR
jgi:peptidoglycan-N-acetylglucosamine deacetylase